MKSKDTPTRYRILRWWPNIYVGPNARYLLQRLSYGKWINISRYARRFNASMDSFMTEAEARDFLMRVILHHHPEVVYDTGAAVPATPKAEDVVRGIVLVDE